MPGDMAIDNLCPASDASQVRQPTASDGDPRGEASNGWRPGLDRTACVSAHPSRAGLATEAYVSLIQVTDTGQK